MGRQSPIINVRIAKLYLVYVLNAVMEKTLIYYRVVAVVVKIYNQFIRNEARSMQQLNTYAGIEGRTFLTKNDFRIQLFYL